MFPDNKDFVKKQKGGRSEGAWVKRQRGDPADCCNRTERQMQRLQGKDNAAGQVAGRFLFSSDRGIENTKSGQPVRNTMSQL